MADNLRVKKAFEFERITKKFYERFKLARSAFLNFIYGIDSQADREWYASLMLNRLMFIYFIQRNGFLDTKSPGLLDGDVNYLSNRLKCVQKRHGEDQFLTFYRHFLLKLFHDGLSKREHSQEIETLLGKVPYLNCALFHKHILERDNPETNIPDEAFQQLFDFFNEYDWHLDDRALRSDNEINPDVLGYIFEKYINQKQMGAYYTKEDISEYISKYTIIPHIFETTEQKCMIAFKADAPVWSLLHENPDRYIYDAVKKGCNLSLPPEIAAGVQDVAHRGEWNQPAPEVYALPTETWREVVARHTQFNEVLAKLANGEITSINDFITYNLNIRQFALDAISYCEGADLLCAFYDSIEALTVLDPTCGSGAFLFAALNVLKTLYNACLDRMQMMIEEHDQLASALPANTDQQHPALDRFRSILREVDKHPNRTYFIYKSIISNNLYGVDIMEEATENCKLRLFLKLVSQVEKFDEIETLPDINRNIHTGNTLVGFATYEETKKAIEESATSKGSRLSEATYQDQVIFVDKLERIEQKVQEIEQAFLDFRKLQIEFQLDSVDMSTNKQHSGAKLRALCTELDGYLASAYGIDPNNIPNKEVYDEKFTQWHHNHQPFHWWVEFYEIMKSGGFDVIIGNPPYVEYEKVIAAYTVHRYSTAKAGNLYALTLERCQSLIAVNGRCGMIVPASATCTDGYLPLQKILIQQSALYISSFSDQRGKLFDIAHPRLCIILYKKSLLTRNVYTTSYMKLGKVLRDKLFQRLVYVEVTNQVRAGVIPRHGSIIEQTIKTKLFNQAYFLRDYMSKSGDSKLYYTRKLSWFVQVTPFVPKIVDENGTLRAPSELKTLSFMFPTHTDIAFATLNSNLFYWFLTVGSDCRNLNMREVLGFPINLDTMAPPNQNTLRKLAIELAEDLQAKSELQPMRFEERGVLNIQCMFPVKSKPIIDEIDRVLANHYGFTDEELDFIINYDIKYRTGRVRGNKRGK